MALIPHYLGESFLEAREAFSIASTAKDRSTGGHGPYTEAERVEVHGAWLRMRDAMRQIDAFQGEWMANPLSRPPNLGAFEALEANANRIATVQAPHSGPGIISAGENAQKHAAKALRLARAEVNSQCQAGENCTPIKLSEGTGLAMGAAVLALGAFLLIRG